MYSSSLLLVGCGVAVAEATLSRVPDASRPRDGVPVASRPSRGAGFRSLRDLGGAGAQSMMWTPRPGE
jgi:hypothetical protein